MFTIITTAEKTEKANKNDQEMLKAVLESDEDALKRIFMQKNSQKNAVWHLAIDHDVSDTIDILFTLGKGLDCINSAQKSVLDLSVAKGDPLFVRRLVHEAGFRKANLFYAAKSTQIFLILVKEAKRNMFEINADGQSLLHAACAYCNYDLVSNLLLAGLNVNLEDRNGLTPIHFAVKSRSLDLVIFLHTNKALLNKPKRYFSAKSNFKPLLIEALKAYDPEILTFLIKNGAGPNAFDEEGRNAVNFACQEGFSNSIIVELLRVGSDPILIDKHGSCALSFLQKSMNALTLIHTLRPDLFIPSRKITLNSSTKCPICKDLIEEQVLKLTCKHHFHQECLQEWQKTSLACPLCSELTANISIPKRKTRMTALLASINKRT